MEAVQQILDAKAAGAVQFGPCGSILIVDISPPGIARLHARAIPAARLLAPVEAPLPNLPSTVTAQHREQLTRACMSLNKGLAHALAEGRISDELVVHQACELLCALSDVIFTAYGEEPLPSDMPNRASSSSSSIRSRRAKEFMDLGCAREV